MKKIVAHSVRTEKISTPYIKLDALLKFAAMAETGGEAKIMIQEGGVQVNGEICTARGKKIYPGYSVGIPSQGVKVLVESEQ